MKQGKGVQPSVAQYHLYDSDQPLVCANENMGVQISTCNCYDGSIYSLG